jgi:hypothetical protein
MLLFLICVFVLVFTQGCTSLQAMQEAYFKENPDTPAHFRDAIKYGQIKLGMPCEMVELSWGEPNNKQKTSDGYEWMYLGPLQIVVFNSSCEVIDIR